ncbi:MAG: RNA polymerase sigma factor [Tannerellaceae bacterium]
MSILTLLTRRESKAEAEKAFMAVIEEHRRIIFKVSYLYALDQDDVKDLYQDIILNLWKSFPQFKGECNISTWIYRISLNTSISRIRKKPAAKAVPLTEAMLIPTDQQSDLMSDVYGLIARLGELDRALILLWLEDRPYDEIADIMGISKGNVAVKLNRVKNKLKQMSNQ